MTTAMSAGGDMTIREIRLAWVCMIDLVFAAFGPELG